MAEKTLAERLCPKDYSKIEFKMLFGHANERASNVTLHAVARSGESKPLVEGHSKLKGKITTFSQTLDELYEADFYDVSEELAITAFTHSFNTGHYAMTCQDTVRIDRIDSLKRNTYGRYDVDSCYLKDKEDGSPWVHCHEHLWTVGAHNFVRRIELQANGEFVVNASMLSRMHGRREKSQDVVYTFDLHEGDRHGYLNAEMLTAMLFSLESKMMFDEYEKEKKERPEQAQVDAAADQGKPKRKGAISRMFKL